MKGILDIPIWLILAVIVIAVGLLIYLFILNPETGLLKLGESISKTLCNILFDNILGKTLGFAGRCG